MARLQTSLPSATAPGIVTSASSTASSRLSRLILVFAGLSVLFFLLLVFLRIPFPLYRFMSWQDTLDLLTPLVLIPVYWLMYRMTTRETLGRPGELVFMVFAAIWTLGQGMHLAANSVDNLIENLAKNQTLDILGTDVYRLTYFFDEGLSHYVWHIGVLGLAGLLMYASWRSPVEERTDWRMVIPAGILYGVTCFAIFVEGQTSPLGFPLAGLAALLALIFTRKAFSRKPVLAFFTLAFLFAFLAIAGWAIYHGTFPPPELL